MITVVHHRVNVEKLKKQYPNCIIHDVTSKAQDKFVMLSPFYPHGGIPVPFSPDYKSFSVEGVWQGLKVFNNCDVDIDCFTNDTMRDLKRTVRKYGNCLGHRKGVKGVSLLDYLSARKQIYVPTYYWVLENKVSNLVQQIKEESDKGLVFLLDYNTNCNVDDTSSPLSHAGLIRAFIGGDDTLNNLDNAFKSKQNTEIKHILKNNKTIREREEFTIPDDITGIDKNAFSKCINLKTLNIPASVKTIGDGAFYGCTELERITVSPDNKHLHTSEDGKVLFADKGKTLVFCSPSLEGSSYVIPKKVKTIGNGAFYGTKFEKIIITESVKTIGNGAFEFCEHLNKPFIIPDNVETIGNDAFAMSSVEDVVIGDGVKSIGDRAFVGCYNLKNIIIGASLKEIGDDVFIGCNDLKNIKVDERNKDFTTTQLTLSKKDGSLTLIPSMSDLNKAVDGEERERNLPVSFKKKRRSKA